MESIHTFTSTYIHTLIHSFIQTISIAHLQVHCYSEALPTQDGYCVEVSRRSPTGNCEWRIYQRSLVGVQNRIRIRDPSDKRRRIYQWANTPHIQAFIEESHWDGEARLQESYNRGRAYSKAENHDIVLGIVTRRCLTHRTLVLHLSLRKTQRSGFVFRLVGHGVFSQIDEDKYRHQRNILNPAFTKQ